MRRTQLYLDDQLWSTLHTQARTRNTTVSELVRQAVREKYFSKLDERKKAMVAFVGSQKGRPEDAGDYIRNLRRGSRVDELHKK